MKKRVVVGLSGGVDSAVTAWLLKQQGHEVIGIFMKNWEEDDDDEYCSSNIDFVDAAAVADVLGIELEHVNFAAEYKDRVFAEFLREHRAGRTPNPDVLCNAEIKFKAFLDHAIRLGADHIATGHYARARERDGRFELLKGLDPLKDQSYFLHRLTQPQLARTWFPIGELPKTEVRRLAAEIGLPNAAKKDSTGICFIGERPFRAFLERYLANQPGLVKDDHGRTIGEHVGLSFYTLGQRKGIGIATGDPLYVVRIDADKAEVIVGPREALATQSFALRDLNWLGDMAVADWPEQGLEVAVRVRSTRPPRSALLTHGPDGAQVMLAEPEQGVSPGQACVIYEDEAPGARVLGGGIIRASAARTLAMAS